MTQKERPILEFWTMILVTCFGRVKMSEIQIRKIRVLLGRRTCWLANERLRNQLHMSNRFVSRIVSCILCTRYVIWRVSEDVIQSLLFVMKRVFLITVVSPALTQSPHSSFSNLPHFHRSTILVPPRLSTQVDNFHPHPRSVKRFNCWVVEVMQERSHQLLIFCMIAWKRIVFHFGEMEHVLGLSVLIKRQDYYDTVRNETRWTFDFFFPFFVPDSLVFPLIRFCLLLSIKEFERLAVYFTLIDTSQRVTTTLLVFRCMIF